MAALAPTNVKATATGSSSVLVEWENAQTTHDNNKVEYRDITAAGAWTLADATLVPTSTEFTVASLTASNEYEFRVTALDAGEGDSAAVESNDVWTWPDGAGFFWGSVVEVAAAPPLDWNAIIAVTSTEPFLRISSFPAFLLSSPIGRNIAPDRVIWGPEIVKPTFPE